MSQLQREKILAVPTNIVTGFLGVGKTTAIQHLLTQKPAGKRWAVLVNEFGEIGIDGSLFEAGNGESQNVFIREVPGGCMCCAAGLPMQMALNLLLARAKPDRLLIEPTGLGHPKEVIQVLQSEYNRDVLSLNSTITMVDARKISNSRYTENDTFNQQLDIADVIVANKSELYNEHDFRLLTEYIDKRHGKQAKPVFAVTHGAIESEWLQGKSEYKIPLHHEDHADHIHLSDSELPQNEESFNEEGFKTVSNQNQEEGYFSQGWVFLPDRVFDRQKLWSTILGIDAERAKGVFITSEGVIGFNKVDEVLTEIHLDDCMDSRFEMITNDPSLLQGVEEQLLACIPHPQSSDAL